ncbi:MAG TPA: hypothetical protein VGI40_09080 [Pirellulaceae bacterium]|jgi:hypothetical protein
MTISLLRRIWQRIHAEPAADPTKQRLTGFEPLEPRMVLSGFMAYYAPDYLSPPPGDFSHIDRSGAEISRPATTFGYSDASALVRGFAEPSETTVVVYNINSPGERLFGGRENDFWFGSGWNSGPASLSGMPSILNSAPNSYLAANAAESEPGHEGSTIGEVTAVPSMLPSGASYVGSYPLISASGVDKVLTDVRFSISSSSQFYFPLQIISMPMNGGLEIRDYAQLNASAERRFEHDAEHETAVTQHAMGTDASLALTVRSSSSSLERGMVNSTAAALSGQAGASSDSISVQTADGSSVTGKVSSQTTDSSIRQQSTLTELTEAERLNLKRKLAGAATLEEAARSSNERGEEYDEADAQLAYDATRPFDVTAIPNGQLRQIAASLADDGLIEVLAADVTSIVASGNAIDQAASNRQIAMEPAVATYQAFETIVDGGSQASDVAGNAARLAAAVAMNAQPVVQAE